MKLKNNKKCKQCGEIFSPTYSTLQPTCSIKCTLLFNSKKEVDKRIKQMKIESQKISDLESVARVWFQKWIRKRDGDLPCISCGNSNADKYDSGHYYKAEIWSGLIFNEHNVHKQCVYCNQHLQGNLIEYRKGLIKRYGSDYVENLESKSNELRSYKYTRDELIEIANTYKKLMK